MTLSSAAWNSGLFAFAQFTVVRQFDDRFASLLSKVRLVNVRQQKTKSFDSAHGLGAVEHLVSVRIAACSAPAPP